MTTRARLVLLASVFYLLAACFLGATVVAPTPVSILLASLAVGSIALGTMGLVAVAALGTGRVRTSLASLLSDPTLVARLLPPREELRRRIHELVLSYHGTGNQGAEITAAAESEIIDRLVSPLRRDYGITVRLATIAPGVVRISRTVSYTACRCAESDGMVFGKPLVYGATVEVKPPMIAAGLGAGDMARFVGMTADGLPLVEGTDYRVDLIPGDGRVRIEVRSEKIFAASQESVRISYTTETLATTTDYMTFTMMTLVYSASLVVEYDPTALNVQVLALVPVDWPIARTGSEVRKGTKVIDLNGRVLVPGHTLLSSWQPK